MQVVISDTTYQMKIILRYTDDKLLVSCHSNFNGFNERVPEEVVGCKKTAEKTDTFYDHMIGVNRES